MPSGGRRRTTWTKRTAPRTGGKKGAKRLPTTFKTTVENCFREIASRDPRLLPAAIERGLRAGPSTSFPFVRLAYEVIDGRRGAIPADRFVEFVNSVAGLFLSVVHDSETQRRFLEGVRQMAQTAVEVPLDVIDIHAAPERDPSQHGS